MLLTVLEFLWWLQPEATGGGGGGGAAGGGGAGGGDAGGMGCGLQIGMFAVMMLVFYFVLLRPEQKRRREHEEMVKSLRKGTKVRTTGGILGEVVTVNDDEVILQIADRVRINVLRAHVTAVIDAKKAEAEKADDKKAEAASDKKKDKHADKKKDEPEGESDEARDEA